MTLTPEQLDAIEARAKAAQNADTWSYDDDEWLVYSHAGSIAAIHRVEKGAATGEHIAGLDPQTALALVARVREADRLEEENKTLEYLRSGADGFRVAAEIEAARLRESIAAEQRARNIADEGLATMDAALVAERAEAESARLRAVVEKLRAGLEPFGRNPRAPSLSRCYAHLTREHAYAAAYLLAETAPDVPADQDGRAG